LPKECLPLFGRSTLVDIRLHFALRSCSAPGKSTVAAETRTIKLDTLELFFGNLHADHVLHEP
jgi:hypothetical protein